MDELDRAVEDVRREQARTRDEILDNMVAAFRARVFFFETGEVEVWKVTLSKPYARGELLRTTEHGIVVAGHGVIPYTEIDRVTQGSVSVSFARP